MTTTPKKLRELALANEKWPLSCKEVVIVALNEAADQLEAQGKELERVREAIRPKFVGRIGNGPFTICHFCFVGGFPRHWPLDGTEEFDAGLWLFGKPERHNLVNGLPCPCEKKETP